MTCLGVKVIGHPSDGPFLYDLNVLEPSFVAWRDAIRGDPSAVKSLCFMSNNRGPTRIRPRVCALPLTVPPGDTELAIAGDWIAEETSRMMSRSSLLSVISHLSGARDVTTVHRHQQCTATRSCSCDNADDRGAGVSAIDALIGRMSISTGCLRPALL